MLAIQMLVFALLVFVFQVRRLLVLDLLEASVQRHVQAVLGVRLDDDDDNEEEEEEEDYDHIKCKPIPQPTIPSSRLRLSSQSSNISRVWALVFFALRMYHPSA